MNRQPSLQGKISGGKAAIRSSFALDLLVISESPPSDKTQGDDGHGRNCVKHGSAK